MEIADAPDAGGTHSAGAGTDRERREQVPVRRRVISAGVIASAALTAAAAGFVVSQIQMVASTGGDLSFWGFAIYLSVVVAVAIGLAVAIGGVVVALIARRLRATGKAGLRAVVLAASVAVIAWGVLGAVITTADWMRTAVVVFWPTLVVSVAVGAVHVGVAVWRRRAGAAIQEVSDDAAPPSPVR